MKTKFVMAATVLAVGVAVVLVAVVAPGPTALNRVLNSGTQSQRMVNGWLG